MTREVHVSLFLILTSALSFCSCYFVQRFFWREAAHAKKDGDADLRKLRETFMDAKSQLLKLGMMKIIRGTILFAVR